MRLAAWLLVATPAFAADRPPTTPQRDVDVEYKMASADPAVPLHQRMRWSVALGRLRVDPPTAGLYMIVDYRAKRMAVVKPADRAVLDMPAAGPGLPGAAAGSYTPLGADQVAGLPCANWQTADGAGRDTVLCLTADGVMLRASQAGFVLIEATRVSYGKQDEGAFSPPDGFIHTEGVTAQAPAPKIAP
jgi:hypothetical protein